MKKINLLLVLSLIFILSCNNSEKKGDESKDSSKVENSNSSEKSSMEGKEKYGIENGMVKYQMDMMGMVMNMTIWFKDFGKFECTETDAALFGQKSITRAFQKDGFAYTVDMTNKTGTKIKITDSPDEVNPADINFENLSDEMKTKYQLKTIGSETVSGKNCTIYSMKYNGSEGKFWVWKNIPMKYEFAQQGVKVVVKAIEVSESPSFPAGIFEIPSGITFQEMDMKDIKMPK